MADVVPHHFPVEHSRNLGQISRPGRVRLGGWQSVFAVFGRDESRHAVNGIRASRRSARTVTRFSPEEEERGNESVYADPIE